MGGSEVEGMKFVGRLGASALVSIALLACGILKREKPAPDDAGAAAAIAPAPTAPVATGLPPECEAYLNAYRCFMSKSHVTQLGGGKTDPDAVVNSMRTTWTQASTTQVGRDAIAGTCKQQQTSMQAQFDKLGCTGAPAAAGATAPANNLNCAKGYIQVGNYCQKTCDDGQCQANHSCTGSTTVDGKTTRYCLPSSVPGQNKDCRVDADCGPNQLCMFIAGDTSKCAPKPVAKTCPKGQVMVKSGECWQACKTDGDCPQGMCCRGDPNAPTTICMGRC
jgi:hypothetical protein